MVSFFIFLIDLCCCLTFLVFYFYFLSFCLPKVLSISIVINIIMKSNSIDDLNDLKEIDRLLDEYKPFYNMYRRLLVIKNVKDGMSRGDAAKVVNVHRKTAENWVKLYNKKGLGGLWPDYSNCGLDCRCHGRCSFHSLR